MSASVGGINPAPANPCSARAKISVSAVGATAAAPLIAPKPAAARINRRLRPIRSPTLPIVTKTPANTNEYTSPIHRIWVYVGFRSASSAGTATLSTVPSMATMKTAAHSTVSADNCLRVMTMRLR